MSLLNFYTSENHDTSFRTLILSGKLQFNTQLSKNDFKFEAICNIIGHFLNFIY